MGPGAAGAAPRRDFAVPVRWGAGSLPERWRLHRRLLRARDLELEHLCAIRLDALSVGRDRRRGRPGLLPAAGAGDRSALEHRRGLLRAVFRGPALGRPSEVSTRSDRSYT